MSLKYTRAVAKAQGLSAKAGNVLRKLADMADGKGRCFPRQTTLAEDLGVSERTVRDALAELVGMCWIEREARWRKDGTRTSDLITVRDLEGAAKAAEAMLRLPLMVAMSGGKSVDNPVNNSAHNRQILPVNNRQILPVTIRGTDHLKESNQSLEEGEAARRLEAAASPETQAQMAARLRAMADNRKRTG